MPEYMVVIAGRKLKIKIFKIELVTAAALLTCPLVKKRQQHVQHKLADAVFADSPFRQAAVAEQFPEKWGKSRAQRKGQEVLYFLEQGWKLLSGGKTAFQAGKQFL